MRLFTTAASLRGYLNSYRSGTSWMHQNEPLNEITASQSGVGLVPTMGSLHAGHLSLFQRARQENSLLVVSIFVNPLQFGPKEDYQRYPRNLDTDRQICEQAAVDAIFAPTTEEMEVTLPSYLTQVVPPIHMTTVLCGRSRPGHFQGVATIITKLLNLVQPERAYFGQKDAQQLAIIQRLVKDLNLSSQIVACPTVREASGIALSSRNQYLTSEQKTQAAVLYRSLQKAEQAFQTGERFSPALIAAVKKELMTVSAVQLEYVELVDPRTLMSLEKVEEEGMLAIAARVGSTRLIDNIVLPGHSANKEDSRQPIVAIDGPAGAGKSTIARQVAQKLGLLYLDTGAMYRALTWLVLQLKVPLDDQLAIAQLARSCQIKLVPSENLGQPLRVWVNDQEVTQAIRTLEVTAHVSVIAAQPAVRQALVQQQQRWGEKGGLVAEGRDIGTHVFPDADLKIFLTASVQERARRRQQEYQNLGEIDVSLAQLEQEITERDWKDSTRTVAPLQKAVDAIEIQTDGLSITQVTAKIIDCYYRQFS